VVAVRVDGQLTDYRHKTIDGRDYVVFDLWVTGLPRTVQCS